MMNSAVADLYRVFQPYRLGDDFCGCSDCVSPHDTERLASKPLHELTVQDLNRYAFKAMTTWGDVRHFKYFLPRLLELALGEYSSFNDPEVLLEKLAYGKWETWPQHERAAVREFLMTFWLHQLGQPGKFPHDDRIETTLGGLAQACCTLQPFLDRWLSVDATIAALHLGQLIDDSADDMMTQGRITNLWADPVAASEQLTNWIASDAVRDYLDGFRETIDGTFPFVMSQLEGVRAAVSRTPRKT